MVASIVAPTFFDTLLRFSGEKGAGTKKQGLREPCANQHGKGGYAKETMDFE